MVVWLNRLEISDEHVLHGRRSLKVHADLNSGHAWVPTLSDSFPPDWSDYDAIRFFVHWPEDKDVQWGTFIWLWYTDAEGQRDWIEPWLLYTMKPGDTHVEIPLAAFDDLKWRGLGGYGGGLALKRKLLELESRNSAAAAPSTSDSQGSSVAAP